MKSDIKEIEHHLGNYLEWMNEPVSWKEEAGQIVIEPDARTDLIRPYLKPSTENACYLYITFGKIFPRETTSPRY